MKERRFKKGIVNHVYQRTIGRFNIFYDLADYLVYYTIFCTFARQAEVIIWGLCIMIDHIHSLIQADSVRELSGFVSRTTSVFVRVYNKELRSLLHLLQRHGLLCVSAKQLRPQQDFR